MYSIKDEKEKKKKKINDLIIIMLHVFLLCYIYSFAALLWDWFLLCYNGLVYDSIKYA